jgi:hypothetical protein
MQRIIDAEKSDLFDVLAHVAYALAPLTREERAAQAMAFISYPLQQQTTGLSRFRALALRQRWRGGTRFGQAEAAAVPEVSRFNCGCRG